MKLLAINSINNVKNQNLQANKKLQNSQNHATFDSISNNSLQEAIGRSQVNFRGTATMTDEGNIKYHNHTAKGKQEGFTYDPATGNFSYNETFKNSFVLSRHIESTPNKQLVVITEKNANSTTTTITKTPEKTTTLTVDPNGEEISYKEESGGYLFTRVTEYKENPQTGKGSHRIVTTTQTEGKTPEVRVYNKDYPNTPVFEGFLVEDWIQTGNTKEFKNIITGAVYEKVTTEDGKTTTTIFSRETLLPVKETIVEPDQTKTTNFNAEGIRTEEIIKNKHGITVTRIFGDDGQTVTQKTKVICKPSNKSRKQIEYAGDTDVIKQATIQKDNQKFIHTHDTESEDNQKTRSQVYTNDVLVRTIDYYKDGKSPKQIVNYTPNGTYNVEIWSNPNNPDKDMNEDGYEGQHIILGLEQESNSALLNAKKQEGMNKKLHTEYYTEDNELEKIVYFDPMTGKPTRIDRKNHNDGSCFIERRIPSGGKLIEFVTDR